MIEMLDEVTGEQPVLWGSSIVGYGQVHYVYESGREGDTCRLGFSPRASASTGGAPAASTSPGWRTSTSTCCAG